MKNHEKRKDFMFLLEGSVCFQLYKGQLCYVRLRLSFFFYLEVKYG